MNAPVKLRIRSTKIGKVRFVSHRDTARLFERALRTVGLPIAMSEGFTPRPRISFGLALPTGGESIAEYTDLQLRSEIGLEVIDLASLPGDMSTSLPRGVDVIAAGVVGPGSASLQEAVVACTWELYGAGLTADDHRSARRLLDADQLVLERERKGKRCRDDVRPAVLDVRAAPTGDRTIVDLATVGRALRPSEFARLAYPHVDPRDVRVLRTHQWIDHDGGRHEVLPLPADVHASTAAVPA